MSTAMEPMRARRYLLGEASEDECAAIEKEYFGHADTLDALEAAEGALIEDYLDGRLGAGERQPFERHYLAAPHHRTRVETIRALRLSTRKTVSPAPIPFANRPRAAAAPRTRMYRTLALAASVVVAVTASLWIARDRGVAPAPAPAVPPVVTPPPAPRVFGMPISPAAVRSAADSPTLVIPAGTDAIDLRFEGEANDKPIVRGRVAVRTVNGDDVWQGATASALGLPAGVIAHAEIPAGRLNVDDYIVTLFEIGPTGTESEKNKYFLRVRSK